MAATNPFVRTASSELPAGPTWVNPRRGNIDNDERRTTQAYALSDAWDLEHPRLSFSGAENTIRVDTERTGLSTQMPLPNFDPVWELPSAPLFGVDPRDTSRIEGIPGGSTTSGEVQSRIYTARTPFAAGDLYDDPGATPTEDHAFLPSDFCLDPIVYL